MQTHRKDKDGNASSLVVGRVTFGAPPDSIGTRAERVSSTFKPRGLEQALKDHQDPVVKLVDPPEKHAPEPPPLNQPKVVNPAEMPSGKPSNKSLREDLLLMAYEISSTYTRQQARLLVQFLDGIYKAQEAAPLEDD